MCLGWLPKGYTRLICPQIVFALGPTYLDLQSTQSNGPDAHYSRTRSNSLATSEVQVAAVCASKVEKDALCPCGRNTIKCPGEPWRQAKTEGGVTVKPVTDIGSCNLAYIYTYIYIYTCIYLYVYLHILVYSFKS